MIVNRLENQQRDHDNKERVDREDPTFVDFFHFDQKRGEETKDNCCWENLWCLKQQWEQQVRHKEENRDNGFRTFQTKNGRDGVDGIRFVALNVLDVFEVHDKGDHQNQKCHKVYGEVVQRSGGSEEEETHHHQKNSAKGHVGVGDKRPVPYSEGRGGIYES